MTRKEKMDLILSKVAKDKKDAFIAEFRNAETKKDRFAVLVKYGVDFTDEEKETIRSSHEIGDEELDEAAGGCQSNCSCSTI